MRITFTSTRQLIFRLFVLGEISRVFGSQTLDYILNLVNGHIDYLPRLSDELLIKIISLLPLEDIIHLSMVSKQFRTVSV
jgi:hypothetical protein